MEGQGISAIKNIWKRKARIWQLHRRDIGFLAIRINIGGLSSDAFSHIMAVKRPPLVNNEIYHIILHGVGDTQIFQDDPDYYRGIFSIYEFNTTKPIEIRLQRGKRQTTKKHGGQTPDIRDRLVDVLAFCLMPNHIHLLIKQLKDNGITKFMKKVGTGYASYFNKKHIRKGHLFRGRFQAVRVKDDNQLRIVFAYIHSNPISLIEPNWKENGIKNFKKSIKFLECY